MWLRVRTVCALLVVAASALATSAPPRPLKRVAHPSTLALEILPRTPLPHGTLFTREVESPRLRHTDSLRLTLAAFGRTHRLHLRPNNDLLHPAARITHLASDGSVISSTPLLRSAVHVFEGAVVDEAWSAHRLREDAAGGVSRPWGEISEGELGWARIIVHDQGDPELGTAPSYEGAFSVLGEVYHILTRDNYVRTRGPLDAHPHPDVDELDGTLVIFRDSDMEKPSAKSMAAGETCSHDALRFNMDESHPVMQAGRQGRQLPAYTGAAWYDPFKLFDAPEPVPRIGLHKREDIAGSNSTSNFADQIGNTAGCSKTQKIVYMGVAADCTYTSRYGGTSNATTMILNDWNTASSLYKVLSSSTFRIYPTNPKQTTFNMSLGIVELAIQDSTCPAASPTPNPAWNTPCADSITLNDRLSLFSAWRGQKSDGAGLWHLMSGCPTGTEVGVAWLGQVCNTQASGQPGNVVSGTAVSTAGRTEWQVVAHEVGHNFGAIHDCTSGCTGTSPCCPLTRSSCDSGSQFIMSPVSSAGEVAFSQCSIGNICEFSIPRFSRSGDRCENMELMPTIPRLRSCRIRQLNMSPGSRHSQANNLTANVRKWNRRSRRRLRPWRGDQLDLLRQPDMQVYEQRSLRPGVERMLFGYMPVCAEYAGVPPLERCDVRSRRDVHGYVGGVPLGPGHGQWDVLRERKFGLSLAEFTGAVQCQTVGVSLNLTRACPSRNDKSCQVSCQDPRTSNQCIVLQANLVDGSPCGYGGTCNNGACKSGSAIETAKAWYTSNLQISIPVTVVVGIIVLLILWGIIRCFARCCGGKRKKDNLPRQRISSWVPQENNRGVAANSGAWNSGQAWQNQAGGAAGYVSPFFSSSAYR
ncbi:hypothetical protein FRC10_012074 [Ceratobasidium sp. 414]|nr:hypothetical protein FRC10_012074 [Ceratobasidium sp. 414]